MDTTSRRTKSEYGLDTPEDAFIIEKFYGEAFTEAALKGVLERYLRSEAVYRMVRARRWAT